MLECRLLIAALLTGCYCRLHETALETLQQSLVHEELSFAASHRYNHLRLTHLPVILNKLPCFADTRILLWPRCTRIFVFL